MKVDISRIAEQRRGEYSRVAQSIAEQNRAGARRTEDTRTEQRDREGESRYTT